MTLVDLFLFDADRGSWNIVMMPILNKLLWMKSCILFVFWHKINMGIMLFRYSVFILDLIPSFFNLSEVPVIHQEKNLMGFRYSYQLCQFRSFS
jgi:hypothetical protein